MSKFTSRVLFSFILIVTFSGLALAQDSHSVWSARPFIVQDGATGAHYNSFVKGDAAFAWTQATPSAYAHALAIVMPALKYDFMLVSTTSSDGDSISGKWIVRRNGVIVCNNCIGKAYGLSQPVAPANYFKIYVGAWLYSGYLTNRFDF